MKALVLKAPNTPFELAQVPDPVAGPGEAVARVLACGSGLTIQHVTLGGAGKPFSVSSHNMLLKEQEILGSRYVTRAEIVETLALVARREVWPIVSDIRPLEDAEALHARVERGEVTGRAALLI